MNERACQFVRLHAGTEARIRLEKELNIQVTPTPVGIRRQKQVHKGVYPR